MIKYIGIALTLIGAALLAYVIMSGRKNDIEGTKAELELITDSGYATTHTEKRQTRTILESTPVKVPPRKRALSREAADILKKVEEEREAERNADLKERQRKMPKVKTHGTAVLEQPGSDKRSKGTDILPESKGGRKGGTAVLPDESSRRQGTDVLPQRRSGQGQNTDVLPSQKSTKRNKGTDILPENKKRSGTDVLPQKKASASSRTDILGSSRNDDSTSQKKAATTKGTDILGVPQKNTPDRTDILTVQEKTKLPASRKGTDVLPERRDRKHSGTDVLPGTTGKRKEGTAVLEQPRKKKDRTEVLTPRGTDVLPERKGE